MTVKNEQMIDIEYLIASKNKRLLKFLPKFVINYLKHIIHQDDINKIISKYSERQGLDFVEAILNEFKVNIKVKGGANIANFQNNIVVANHPLGGLDGIALMKVFGDINKNVIFPVNDFLLNIPNLKQLFVPINKHGSNAKNIDLLNNVFISDKNILYFPAGVCSRKISGKIIDPEWKKTIVTKAKKYNKNIIPAHINGCNSNFFYNLANFRKKLRIKTNIEMIFLVNEMFKQKNKEIVITIGKPIMISSLAQDIKDITIAKKLKEHVYELDKNPEKNFVIN